MTPGHPADTGTGTGSKARIVVGVDGSAPARAALARAALEAVRSGSVLCAVTAWEPPTTLGWAPPVPDEDVAEAARGTLQRTLAEILGPEPEMPVETDVVQGHPAPVLLARAEGADLLVVGASGHGAFTGMLLGSVTEHCVHHATCPVLVVRSPATEHSIEETAAASSGRTR